MKADVVAGTFVIIWRKIDELPPGAEARLWVYGVARSNRTMTCT